MDIARLIKQAHAAYEDGTTPLRYVDLFKELADALRMQAQEIERLKDCEDRSQRRISALANSADRHFEAYMKASTERRALAQENERLKGVVAQIQPPNDIGDNCTAELAVKCAELEQRLEGKSK